MRGKAKLDGHRQEMNTPGKISFAGTSADCLVVNLSSRGAGIALASDIVLPSAFELEICGERRRRRCLVVWRIERQLGVTFGPAGGPAQRTA